MIRKRKPGKAWNNRRWSKRVLERQREAQPIPNYKSLPFYGDVESAVINGNMNGNTNGNTNGNGNGNGKNGKSKGPIVILPPPIDASKYIAEIRALTKKQKIEYAKAAKSSKKPVGQPSTYHPDLCERAIEVMACGRGITELAVYLGVRAITVNKWRKKYPEFNKAVKIGKALAKSWWREVARLNLFNSSFNHMLWMMNMQNRYRWSRRIEGSIDTTSKLIRENKEVKELRLTVEGGDHYAAEVARILAENGAIKPAIEAIACSEDDEIHTSQAGAETSSIPVVDVS